MESFDPRCVHVLKKKYPHIIRGQLTEDFFNSESKLPAPLKWMMKHQVLNFLTLPDFVAYNYRDLDAISNTIEGVYENPAYPTAIQYYNVTVK